MPKASEVTMSIKRNKNNGRETGAEIMFNHGKAYGFSPVSVLESESDFTIAGQAEQIRTLQKLLTQERFKNAKLLVLADGLMDIIAKHDIPLSENVA
jgi:hypothetical protein